jgi:hypothetical protein
VPGFSYVIRSRLCAARLTPTRRDWVSSSGFAGHHFEMHVTGVVVPIVS